MDQVMAFLVALVATVIPGFGQAPAPAWNGYVEADYVYIAPTGGGAIAHVAVAEGQAVAAGDVLFTLDDGQHRALFAAAEARVAAAEANLENLSTGGREAEIEVIRASLARAEADLALAAETAERSERLQARGIVPQARRDQDVAALTSARAAVRQLEAQLEVAELPARDAQRLQAEANVAAARAERDKVAADLAERTVLAPVAGRIERRYFHEGEVAGAGVPVLALLPADALKVKFYLPQADRAAFALDQVVAVSCDGCAEGLTARVTYFADDPQFTPPVIYSRDERQRLAFLTEAVLESAEGLHPGQPVTIARLP